MSEPVIICRCEDVTQAEIQELIKQGKHTLEELKRECRCGMGPCQGSDLCTPYCPRACQNIKHTCG